MYLVEILLPIGIGQQASDELERLRTLLMERFGGLTAFLRAPADGLWRSGAEEGVSHDEIAVIEVMADAMDRAWWTDLRQDLERQLGQKQIVIRYHRIHRV